MALWETFAEAFGVNDDGDDDGVVEDTCKVLQIAMTTHVTCDSFHIIGPEPNKVSKRNRLNVFTASLTKYMFTMDVFHNVLIETIAKHVES